MSDRNAATQSSNRRSKSSNGVPCEQSMTIKELVTNDLTVEDVACCVVRNLSREVDRRLLAELFFQVRLMVQCLVAFRVPTTVLLIDSVRAFCKQNNFLIANCL
jgi:hypothetical protein